MNKEFLNSRRYNFNFYRNSWYCIQNTTFLRRLQKQEILVKPFSAFAKLFLNWEIQMNQNSLTYFIQTK